MYDTQQAFKVGSDPRMLPEYEIIRGEINKLSHASRPDVDWQRVHDTARLIFEKQGVDLQTAVYFVLARARLYGLSGFTEGCELLSNLIVTQWETFWPPVHQDRARVEMLDWFIARVSDVVRQYAIGHEDKRAIYRCERALQLISEKLHNVGLKRVPRVENLIHFIEGYTHLFDETEIVIVSDEPETPQHSQPIPSMVYFHPGGERETAVLQSNAQNSIYVGLDRGEIKPKIVKIQPRKQGKPAGLWFTVGVISGAVPLALFIAWSHWNNAQAARLDEAVALLNKPAQAMPDGFNVNQLRDIRLALGEQTLRDVEPQVTNGYLAQLTRIEQASPLWVYQYGDTLRNAVRILYPDSLAAHAMDNQWQQMLRTQISEPRGEQAWLAVERRVNGVLAELKYLEESRKTVTISYLKSALYEIQKNHNQDIPFSVRLQRLETRQANNESLRASELTAMMDELRSFNARMYRLQQPAIQP